MYLTRYKKNPKGNIKPPFIHQVIFQMHQETLLNKQGTTTQPENLVVRLSIVISWFCYDSGTQKSIKMLSLIPDAFTVCKRHAA